MTPQLIAGIIMGLFAIFIILTSDIKRKDHPNETKQLYQTRMERKYQNRSSVKKLF